MEIKLKFIDLKAFIEDHKPKPYTPPEIKKYDLKSAIKNLQNPNNIKYNLETAQSIKNLYGPHSIKYNNKYTSEKFNPYKI